MEKDKKFCITMASEMKDAVCERSKALKMSTSSYITLRLTTPVLLEESATETVYKGKNNDAVEEITKLLDSNNIPYRKDNLNIYTFLTYESMKTVYDCTNESLRNNVEKKTGYSEWMEYIKNTYNRKVSRLDIAQVKRKYGLQMKNITFTRNHNYRVQTCTSEHEALILRTFVHFGIIKDSNLTYDKVKKFCLDNYGRRVTNADIALVKKKYEISKARGKYDDDIYCNKENEEAIIKTYVHFSNI